MKISEKDYDVLCYAAAIIDRCFLDKTFKSDEMQYDSDEFKTAFSKIISNEYGNIEK